MNYFENRPWGSFEILYGDDSCKVKKIVVNQGQKLSYQSHTKRDELWMVVSGCATVTLNDKIITLNYGEKVEIGKEDKHRVENRGNSPLVFIEIQTGSYFGEDDIIRYEDDYNRK